VRDQDGWLLRYPLQGRSFYDERPFNLPIETTVPLVGKTREDSLQMAEFLLRDHKPPKIPAEPAEVQQTPPAKFAMRRSALILRLPEGGGEIVALRIRGKGNFLLTKSQ
jgi:hypothetical protein